ncbi:GNAT family N-acetyltransferase [Bhargavaea ginsengi]|uniref:GNAT family N-acetyltransferase n=1 Tax=Bhargavaea ginsengi TaxID=426757 RepID=UPI00203E5A45|nr:GNAT family protein [Bhargavaea ginsengi]MCM3088582.1 GNAT family N-acetyltransferase [Bhargavaea ginsengi]
MKKIEFETERLILRPYQDSDYAAWLAGLQGRGMSSGPYDEGRPRDLSGATEEWFREWILGFREAADADDMVILGIFRKSDGANVGKVELITILRFDYDWGMMGYHINNQYSRRGYGKEAVSAAVEFFMDNLGFHRIELHIRPDNLPSKRLAEKAGFLFEGTRERFAKEGGIWLDYDIYTRIKQEKAGCH